MIDKQLEIINRALVTIDDVVGDLKDSLELDDSFEMARKLAVELARIVLSYDMVVSVLLRGESAEEAMKPLLAG